MPVNKNHNTHSMRMLRTIGTCRWASSRTLKLHPISTRTRNNVLKILKDEGYISVKPMKGGKRYKLTADGVKRLHASNPERYQDTGLLQVGYDEYRDDVVIRTSRIGEAIIMAEQSGYAVHVHDRPPITALTELSATRVGAANSVRNINRSHYYTEAERRRRSGNSELDSNLYARRSTPVGCFYPANELKSLAARLARARYHAEKRELVKRALQAGAYNREEEDQQDKDAEKGVEMIVKYTRIEGMLMTSEGGWRVYGSEYTAPQIRPSGEQALAIYLDKLCQGYYGSSIHGLPTFDKSYLRGSILFGDKNCRAGVSVMYHSNRLRLNAPNTRRDNNPVQIMLAKRRYDDEENRVASTFNLDIMGSVYFIPVIREAQPLLGLMLFERWEESIRRAGYENSILYDKGEPLLKGEYDARLDDKRMFACMIPLDMRRLTRIINALEYNTAGVVLQVMEWQRPFIEMLKSCIKDINYANRITVETAPPDILERGFLHQRWYHGQLPPDEAEAYQTWLEKLGDGNGG